MYFVSHDEYQRLKKIEEKYNQLVSDKGGAQEMDGKGEPETNFASSLLRFQQVKLDENKSKKQKPTKQISIMELKEKKPMIALEAYGEHHDESDEHWYYIGSN